MRLGALMAQFLIGPESAVETSPTSFLDNASYKFNHGQRQQLLEHRRISRLGTRVIMAIYFDIKPKRSPRLYLTAYYISTRTRCAGDV